MATDLQEVVQRQQQELDARRPGSATASAVRPARSSSSTESEGAINIDVRGDRYASSSNIAQLKSLVKLVRAGLHTSQDAKATQSSDQSKQATTTGTTNNANTNVSQLKEEIAHLRSQLEQVQAAATTDSKIVGQKAMKQINSGSSEAERLRAALFNAEMDVQKTASEAKTLRSRLQDAEDMVQSLENKLVVALKEVEEAVYRAEQAESRVKTIEKDKEDALKLATDATEEAGRLHAACCAKDTKVLAAQRLAERASTEQAAAEAKAASAEAAIAMERSSRASKETELVRAHAEIQSLKAALEDGRKKARMDAASYGAQLDALHEQLATAQHDARTAQQELQAATMRLRSMEEANSLSQKTIHSTQERLREQGEEVEAAIARAEAAEKELEALKELQRDLETSLGEAEAKNLEIAALKEVLDRVSYAAQAKDAKLQQLMGQRDMLTQDIHNLKGQIHEVEVAAADECTRWENEVHRLEQVIEAGRANPVEPPIKLDIKVVDNSAETEKILREQHEAELIAVREDLERVVTEEQREHRQRVRALEEAHQAALQSARAAAELPLQQEIEILEQQVATLDSQYQGAQRRIRALESELLAVQDQAAKFNSAMGKLEMRCAKYKEDYEDGKIQSRALQEKISLLENEKMSVESELQAAQRELQLAQDEIETLLAARLEDLRLSKELDSNELEDISFFDDGSLDQEEYAKEADSVYPGSTQSQPKDENYLPYNRVYTAGAEASAEADDDVSEYNDTIHDVTPPPRSSPLKKLANFLRGKKQGKEPGYLMPTQLDWATQ